MVHKFDVGVTPDGKPNVTTVTFSDHHEAIFLLPHSFLTRFVAIEL